MGLDMCAGNRPVGDERLILEFRSEIWASDFRLRKLAKPKLYRSRKRAERVARRRQKHILSKFTEAQAHTQVPLPAPKEAPQPGVSSIRL